MIINRHNYEEFFLLYVDNELSAADRKAVELFVQENADLEEELNILQQTVFDADAIVFEHKASLVKEEITALHQNLLLYVDDELTAEDKLQTEKLLRLDTAASKELALLQQTKLQPEANIVFANKKILYRSEKGKVIGLPWRRIAAAAILLGFGSWAAISYIGNRDSSTGGGKGTLATTGSSAAAPGTNSVTIPGSQQPTQQSQTTLAEVNTGITATNTRTQPATSKDIQPAGDNRTQQDIDPVKDNGVALAETVIKTPGNNNLSNPYDNINNGKSNKIEIASVTPVNTTIETIKPAVKIPVAENSHNDVVVNGYALNANYTEGDDTDNLSQDDSKGKRSKLGGFFRKVKRLVDRNTNVTSGNSVKIAGFDIAIK